MVLPIMGMLVAIIAILSDKYYKLEKAKLQSGANTNVDVKLLENIKSENEALKERISNLELIVTNIDETLLLTEARDNTKTNTDKIKRLSEKFKS